MNSDIAELCGSSGSETYNTVVNASPRLWSPVKFHWGRTDFQIHSSGGGHESVSEGLLD